METLTSFATIVSSLSYLPIFSPKSKDPSSIGRRILRFSISPRNNDNESELRSDSNDSSLVPILSNCTLSKVIYFYEQDWNPQVDRQALQRAHRIGQMNHILTINLVTGRTIEEVIMHRANRKLQPSHNVVGEDVMDCEGKEITGAEVGDLGSVIFGLQRFDPIEMSNENSDEPNTSELNATVEKILTFRHGQRSSKDNKKLEINPNDISDGRDLSPSSVTFDPGLDEASYLS